MPPSASSTTPTPPAVYVGEVVYVYAFDVAYDTKRTPIASILGQPVRPFTPDASKRGPRQLFFYRAQMARLPALDRVGPFGPVRVERTVKVLPVGALSFTMRVPFRVSQLSDLIAFHDLVFSDGISLYDQTRELADAVRKELAAHWIRPSPTLDDEEGYTVFCIDAAASPALTAAGPDGRPVAAADWLAAHRQAVASLITEEPQPARLSQQEADESTGKAFSYYERDLVLMDWDAAVIVDEPRYFDETLYILELANMQLAELEAYDRLLDDAVERAYADLGLRLRRPGSRGFQRELREIRVDLARLSDELSNITKFFGDWHLARIYQGLAARFHLSDWHRSIDEKLKTLDEMYQLLQGERNNRWMLTLEVTVVVLFVIDLVILVVGLRK